MNKNQQKMHGFCLALTQREYLLFSNSEDEVDLWINTFKWILSSRNEPKVIKIKKLEITRPRKNSAILTSKVDLN